MASCMAYFSHREIKIQVQEVAALQNAPNYQLKARIVASQRERVQVQGAAAFQIAPNYQSKACREESDFHQQPTAAAFAGQLHGALFPACKSPAVIMPDS